MPRHTNDRQIQVETMAITLESKATFALQPAPPPIPAGRSLPIRMRGRGRHASLRLEFDVQSLDHEHFSLFGELFWRMGARRTRHLCLARTAH
jgi:hypothetical protein